MRDLSSVFMILGPISPIAALVCVFHSYDRHCNRISPDRRVPVVVYALAVIICGAITGYFGLFWGIEHACDGPTAPNLCGLWGFFVTGPIALALGMCAIGLALFLTRRAPTSDGQ